VKKLKVTMSFEFLEEDFKDLMDSDGLTLEEAVQQELDDGNIDLANYLSGQQQSEETDV
jgi:hypothetical protein